MHAAYGFHHTCAGFCRGFVDTHIVVSFRGNGFIWSVRDTVVTSFLCVHMLGANLLVVMRQPMNFNGMGLNCMVRYKKNKKKNNSIFFIFFFLFSPLLSFAFTVQRPLYSEENFHFPLHKRVRIIWISAF